MDALLDPKGALRTSLRGPLAQSTRLSLPMVDWTLDRLWVATRPPRLARLFAELSVGSAGAHPQNEPGVGAIVLAGNVYAASLLPTLAMLYRGTPVLLKASSREDVFPRALASSLAEALAAADPELRQAVVALTFPRDASALQQILSRSTVVHAYGNDRTMHAIAAALPEGVAFRPHGHGFGVCHIARGATRTDATMTRTALRTAEDVAAYDQRGCLSPHAVLVEEAGDGLAFAKRLAEALDRVAERLPPGPASLEEEAQCAQWRGVAAVLGTLFRKRSFAVSFEGDAALRLSPGRRHVQVLTAPEGAVRWAQLKRLGPHLKCFASTLGPAARGAIADRLPPGTRICRVGHVQRPPLNRDQLSR